MCVVKKGILLHGRRVGQCRSAHYGTHKEREGPSDWHREGYRHFPEVSPSETMEGTEGLRNNVEGGPGGKFGEQRGGMSAALVNEVVSNKSVLKQMKAEKGPNMAYFKEERGQAKHPPGGMA